MSAISLLQDRHLRRCTDFGEYLAGNGVRFFSASEMTTPNHPDIAAELGYTEFLPPREFWHKGLLLALVADECRRLAKGPVHMRNWWRPEEYNARVSTSSSTSDHPHADGIDLDFTTLYGKEQALEWLEHLYGTELFEMSLGIYGSRSVHIGMFSIHGQRRW